MNEVRLVPTAVVAPVDTASSKGRVESEPTVNGNSLPEEASTQEAEALSKATPASAEELMSEIETVNDFVHTVQRDLQFTVDKELDRTVIKVVDSDSGEVIRQIPEDIFLELARRLKDDGEMNLLNALG